MILQVKINLFYEENRIAFARIRNKNTFTTCFADKCFCFFYLMAYGRCLLTIHKIAEATKTSNVDHYKFVLNHLKV
jgi:hypothetical protein